MIIYSATNINNNKIYIGQSQQSLEKRWKNHLRDYNRNDKNTHFYNAIRKYGTECWKVEVLEEVNNIELLNEAEMKWIEHYDTFNRDKGYNSTSGGENGFIFSNETKEKLRQAKLGHIVTEETKEKMREKRKLQIFSEATKEKIRQAKLGKKRGPMSEEQKEKLSQAKLGKKLTEEHKEKLSQANLGKKRSEESKEKMKLAKLGKHHSEETKEKMRQARLGKKLTEEHKEKMRQASLGKKRGPYKINNRK